MFYDVLVLLLLEYLQSIKKSISSYNYDYIALQVCSQCITMHYIHGLHRKTNVFIFSVKAHYTSKCLSSNRCISGINFSLSVSQVVFEIY